MQVQVHRMTVSSIGYDPTARRAVGYEMHFKAARGGDIRRVRREMARRGVEYFQAYVYRRHRRWVPKGKIRVGFERERPATKTEPLMMIEVRRMEFVGRQYEGYPLPSRRLPYVKRRRKFKTRR